MTSAGRANARPLPAALVAAAIIIVTALTRASAFGNPVYSGDDQLYWLFGKAILAGQTPYVDIWDRKPVGIYLIYAAIAALPGATIATTQIVAGLFVAATAALIFAIARHFASDRGALFSALGFLICLPVFKGASAQTQLFYNPLIAGAALLTLREWLRPTGPAAMASAAAMLLGGLAFAIRQTVIFEVALFGLALLAAWWRLERWQQLAKWTLMLALVFALPILISFAAFWQIGALNAYWDSAFLSIFRKGSEGSGLWIHLRFFIINIAPLAVLAWIGARSRRDARNPADLFLLSWIATAVIGVAVIGRFYRYYPIPLLLPLSTAASPLFDRRRAGPAGLGALTLLALLNGDIRRFEATRQSIDGFDALTKTVRANLHGRCLYVADGPALLYEATGSCRPTRFQFPDHLATIAETHALPADPAAEMRRILAQRPSVIVLAQRPPDEPRDPLSWPILRAAIANDYRRLETVKFPIDYKPQAMEVWVLSSR